MWWSKIVGLVTGGVSQYKAWIYAAIAVLIVGLGIAVYVFQAKAETATVKLKAANKERDYYQFQLSEAVASHNGYVAKLEAVQEQKQKVQVVYRDKMRRINDENLGAIDGPVVVFSMRDLDAYTDAPSDVAR